MKKEKLNQYTILLGLKIKNYVKNAKNVKNRFNTNNGLIKDLPNMHQFCNGDINKFVCC